MLVEDQFLGLVKEEKYDILAKLVIYQAMEPSRSIPWSRRGSRRPQRARQTASAKTEEQKKNVEAVIFFSWVWSGLTLIGTHSGGIGVAAAAASDNTKARKWNRSSIFDMQWKRWCFNNQVMFSAFLRWRPLNTPNLCKRGCSFEIYSRINFRSIYNHSQVSILF